MRSLMVDPVTWFLFGCLLRYAWLEIRDERERRRAFKAFRDGSTLTARQLNDELHRASLSSA